MHEIVFMNQRMHPVRMSETVKEIKKNIEKKKLTQHVVVNVAKLVNMRKDPELKKSVDCCDIINIDGMGVVLGARFCGYDIPERVAGIDLFHELLRMSQDSGYPVYFLGAKQEVLDVAVSKLEKMYPKLEIAGAHHGYFWNDEEAVVQEISKSGAKLLFVAISSPKKENFINRWKDELGVSFAMGVGGTFDVVAGKVERAPLWMQKYGLEWLFRCIQEPRRMWKRYLVTNSAFALYLLKSKLWGGEK